jgi:hypothetical protein
MWLCVDQVRVKGKQQVSRVYTILSFDQTSPLVELCKEVQERWIQIQYAYQAQQWEKASDLLVALVDVAKPIFHINWDVLCGLYLSRIKNFKSHSEVNLPKDWFHHDAT